MSLYTAPPAVTADFPLQWSEPAPPDMVYALRAQHMQNLRSDERVIDWYRAAYENDHVTLRMLLDTGLDYMIDARGICSAHQRFQKSFNGYGECFVTYYYETYYGDFITDATVYFGSNVVSASLSHAAPRRGFTALEFAAMQQCDECILLLWQRGARDVTRLQQIDPDSVQYLEDYLATMGELDEDEEYEYEYEYDEYDESEEEENS